jgi:uncharacterized phage protein gp47/JayE
MPFIRPTLTELRQQVAQDIASALPGTDPLLRFSNLNTMGTAQAGLANLHYGYLDWIARQAVPFTATDEFLEGWAGLIGITRIPATSAAGQVTFNGAAGATIPVGTSMVRGDGKTCTVTVASVVGIGGTATVTATADADPSGATGAFGNCAAGTTMTLAQAIAGVQSSGTVSVAFFGGADLETDDSLRTRMLSAYQNQPQGGAASDYVRWALQVPGVTRAWAAANGFGAGTVVVYVMLDSVRADQGGFPQGVNGVAAEETRGAAAAGDQLLVADYILPLQPATALVYAVSPIANPVPFTIQGIPASVQSAIPDAINGVFQDDGAPGGTIPLAKVWSAIAAVSGAGDFVIVSPAADIANGPGRLPTVGTITFTA